jgi:hypothetical protein
LATEYIAIEATTAAARLDKARNGEEGAYCTGKSQRPFSESAHERSTGNICRQLLGGFANSVKHD